MKLTPPIIECQLYAAKIGLPEREAQKFWHYYESVGWRTKVGPLKNWHSAMVGWKLRSEDYGNSTNNSPNHSQRPRPFTGAEQRQCGIPEIAPYDTVAIIASQKREREAREAHAAAKKQMATAPVQSELGSAGGSNNG